MSIKVLSVKYVGINKNQTLATVSVDDSEPFGFFVALDNDDESDVYKAVIQEIRSGEIEILPSDTDLDEYYSVEVREKRNNLLSETDKYMTIDYPISDEDKKSLQLYRQSLRDITEQDGFPSNVVWPHRPEIHKLK